MKFLGNRVDPAIFSRGSRTSRSKGSLENLGSRPARVATVNIRLPIYLPFLNNLSDESHRNYARSVNLRSGTRRVGWRGRAGRREEGAYEKKKRDTRASMGADEASGRLSPDLRA